MVAHLNIHTSFDLLDSSLRIDALIDKAKKEGYRALAITDTNVFTVIQSFMMLVLQLTYIQSLV